MNNITALEYVKILELQPHPEGGYYREVYRSSEKFVGEGDFPDGRNFGTAIYFLIEEENFSAFHRIHSDETWHFYGGDPLEVIEINNAGELKKTIIGNDILSGQYFQYTVPAGVWFASRVFEKGNFSLVGCTVAPGFDFRDFEMAIQEKLVNRFPELSDIIKQLTRK